MTLWGDDVGRTCWTQRVIVHELGHAFGFKHEHQRLDRDRFVEIFLEHVDPTRARNFDLLVGAKTIGKYDFLSIMHYRKTSFSIDGQPTMLPIGKRNQKYTDVMGRVVDPSKRDYRGMKRLYRKT